MPIIYLWVLLGLAALVLVFLVRGVLNAIKDVHDRANLLCALIIGTSILGGCWMLSRAILR